MIASLFNSGRYAFDLLIRFSRSSSSPKRNRETVANSITHYLHYQLLPTLFQTYNTVIKMHLSFLLRPDEDIETTLSQHNRSL